MSETANQAYFDASLRHAIEVRNFQLALIKKILPILEAADRDLVRQLRLKLEELGLPAARDAFSVVRLKALLADLRAARAELFRRVQEEVTGDLTDFAKLEASVEEELITGAIGVQLLLATINLKYVAALVDKSPFMGAILGDWFKTLTAADQQRLNQAVTLGVVNGETIPQIVTRVVGTRANGYQDGAMSVSRRNAESIVRTAVNHISNAARQQVWEANQDIVSKERWVSTLDGRTTPICRARDGMEFPIGEGPRPPAHWGCRSVMVAVLDGVGIVGERPYVTDERTRDKREVDFRAEAKKRGVPIQQVRKEWAAKNIGQSPATVTYQEWLGKQSAEFQNKVLGPSRGKLFRDGGLTVQQFVDRAGNELTLKQLKELYPAAWAKSLGS